MSKPETTRDIEGAIVRVANTSDAELALLVRRDPDMIRDVARAHRKIPHELIAVARSEAAAVRISYPSRVASQRVRDMLSQLCDALEGKSA